MEKFLNALFSMRAMALAMTVFFIAIGWATFIESDHGIQAAKIVIYNALWFEILLAYLSVNLMANIFRYKMWAREKIAMLSFHVSFLVIIIGAALTRFVGFEGVMHIREGQTSNVIHSSDPYLTIFSHDDRLKYSEKMWLSDYTNNDFDIDVTFPGKPPVRLEYVKFMQKHIDSLVINDSIDGDALVIVTDGMKPNYVPEDDIFILSTTQIAYGNADVEGINVYKKNGKLMMRPTVPVQYLPMDMMQEARRTGAAIPDSAYVQVQPNEEVPFATTTLYMMGQDQFVFKQTIQHAKKVLLPSGKKDVGIDYLVVKATQGKDSEILTLPGGMGVNPEPVMFPLNGKSYSLEYGAKEISLPFSIGCKNFIIERYPGSDMASSYASDLQVLDSAKNYFKEKRVFMNHVMDYDGYRFFQSSFDNDEKGTILSVNYDWWGTNVTYIGYLLMAIGMVLSLFAPSGRFRELIGKILRSSDTSKIASVVVVAFVLNGAFAQDTVHTHEGHNHETEAEAEGRKRAEADLETLHYFMTEEQSDDLARLLVQDFRGRIVPMHTVCDELLRKLYRANTYKDPVTGKKYNAVQTIMSIQVYGTYWANQKIIQVPLAVQEKYHLDSYTTFKEISTEDFKFKWEKDYNTAMLKSESKRSETEKKLIKLAEKHQVFIAVVRWGYMQLVPVKGDPMGKWHNPLEMDLSPKDAKAIQMFQRYFINLHDHLAGQKSIEPGRILDSLLTYQRATAPASILPSERHVSIEISYNNMQIFKNAGNCYAVLGFLLLLLYIVNLLQQPAPGEPERERTPFFIRKFRLMSRILVIPLIVVFLYHGAGLGMRWYISGHVPWSNGYEAMVWIAWVAVMVGFIFMRFNIVILALAVLLAYFLIFVSEMNLLDPEVTPLQPVLKSYWLMIHVAIITGSYAFLGLSAMLGLINLFLYMLRNRENGANLTRATNTLTSVSEMIMTIGLFMLTIGTFLGGVWANESWGRYWGWDPKETWALVSVLVYAIILHLRFIPALKSKIVFNIVSLWGYSAILFTFFGVNFILVGLHSYAQGDGAVGLPLWLILTIIAFAAFTVFAIFRNNRYNKQLRSEL